MVPLRIGVVGLGNQAMSDHLPAIIGSDMFELVGLCDVDGKRLEQATKIYEVKGYSRFDDMLNDGDYDVMMMTLPHCYYMDHIQKAATHGIHVIKEKPFAVSMSEAAEMQRIILNSGIYVGVTLQRRFNPVFQAVNQLKRRIGKIYLVEGKYTFNIKNLDEGWRASKQLAGGGALIDMGYHIVDLMSWYFGMPYSVSARLSMGNREGQVYDVEDTANLTLCYMNGGGYDQKTIAHLLISRTYPEKHEEIKFVGTNGTILLQRGSVTRFDQAGNQMERLVREGSWPSAAVDQLEYHAGKILGHNPDQALMLHEQLGHIAIVEAAYRSDKLERSVKPTDILSEHGYSNFNGK